MLNFKKKIIFLVNKHFIRINLSTSQFLSEYSSCRVKQSVNFKRQRGEHIGKIPYGFCKDVNGKLIKKYRGISYIWGRFRNMIGLYIWKSTFSSNPKYELFFINLINKLVYSE